MTVPAQTSASGGTPDSESRAPEGEQRPSLAEVAAAMETAQERPPADVPETGTQATPLANQLGVSGLAAKQPGPTSLQPLDDEPEVHRLTRDRDDAWLAGVASGIAKHVGWPTMTIRLGFVALSFVYFLGGILYGVLWVLLPVAEREQAPGIEAATRQGLRQRQRRRRTGDVGAITGMALLTGGALWGASVLGLTVSASYSWPLAVGATGLALVWRQADDSGGDVPPGTKRWLVPFVTLGGWPALIRMLVGLLLLGSAFAMLVATQVPLADLPWVLTTTALVVGGLALVGAPWIYRARRRLRHAYEARVMADARADMAAHLHDSVLQTLALIQRQADDPKAVASVARRQERELRDWLYGGMSDQTHLNAALLTAAQEVEDEREIPVEVVCVGDAEITDGLAALVQAAREAMMNAAKHSGADKIDVYAEVDAGTVEVFIRDRGVGFTMAEIADDRMGVRGSIINRMERHDGRAAIRSAPGEGTEIRLEMQT